MTDTLKALDEIEAALRQMIYETTSLSPLEDDGSHKCRITKSALKAARQAYHQTIPTLRAALTQPAAVEDGELRRLMAEATPRPWLRASDKLAAGNIKAPDNAALIVAAVNALPGLMAERDRMREALEPFSRKASYWLERDDIHGLDDDDECATEIRFGDLRRARAALGEQP